MKLVSNTKYLFYSFWFICLFIQAYFTEITYDEAYYWMYSRELTWGYFDHPPAIAFIIKLGYSLFSNELGVRLIPIILSTLTIFILEKIIKPKEIKTFFMLVMAVGLLHFIGFFAIPDSPLLFTSVLYLFIYQKFIIKPNLLKSLLLGFVIALMCLSKYHAIIIIFLTILSNLKLLINKYFWIAAITTCLFLIPHVYWQISAGFPSIYYHLFERSTEAYKFTYSIEYIASQLVLLGPITGILFFIAAIKIKADNQFEKTLKTLFWGGYIFFFLMSFKGRIEAHWTLFIVLPAIYFGYYYLIKLKNTNKVINYIFSISLLLIIIVRVFIAIDIKSTTSSIIYKPTKQFRNKEKMLAIKKQAKEYPVAFMNSYQDASLYSFYTKSEGFSLNNTKGRKNQFDIWNVEEKYRGQKIMMIPNYNVKEFDSIKGISKTIRYHFIDNFQSFSKVKIEVNNFKNTVVKSDTLKLTISLKNTFKNKIDFSANKEYPSFAYYQFFEGKKLIKQQKGFKISNKTLNKDLKVKIITPDKPDNYGLYLTIKTGWLPTTINSERYKIRVLENMND
ncbi:ArnT family glycosyltransferase [Polaribacter sp. Asnod1-A03]|uniref:ArnT family glycosyltransferase n=1 Tax=Polaribacter sp. Asnod1-A03 TaxID=3160581 RepID=UPI003869D04A